MAGLVRIAPWGPAECDPVYEGEARSWKSVGVRTRVDLCGGQEACTETARELPPL